jgi:hypothetical protein
MSDRPFYTVTEILEIIEGKRRMLWEAIVRSRKASPDRGTLVPKGFQLQGATDAESIERFTAWAQGRVDKDFPLPVLGEEYLALCGWNVVGLPAWHGEPATEQGALAYMDEMLAAGKNWLQSGQPAPGSGTSIEQPDIERIVEAVGDENTLKILASVGRKDLSGDQKMQELIGLDKRFAGKNSSVWAKLLGVTPPAVRSYGTWKELRRQAKTLD